MGAPNATETPVAAAADRISRLRASLLPYFGKSSKSIGKKTHRNQIENCSIYLKRDFHNNKIYVQMDLLCQQ